MLGHKHQGYTNHSPLLGEGRSTFSTEEATLLFLVLARRAAEKRGVPEKRAEECPVHRHQGMGSV